MAERPGTVHPLAELAEPCENCGTPVLPMVEEDRPTFPKPYEVPADPTTIRIDPHTPERCREARRENQGD